MVRQARDVTDRQDWLHMKILGLMTSWGKPSENPTFGSVVIGQSQRSMSVVKGQSWVKVQGQTSIPHILKLIWSGPLTF